MAFVKVEIANMALSHIGVGVDISNLTTDRTAEANAVNRFFDVALDKTLRDFRWPFATQFRALALVAEDPTVEWDFSYRYPTDCLLVRRVLSDTRNDSRQSRIPYIIAQDSQGKLIFTDRDEACIEFTKRETDTTRWTADYVMTFSYYLAWLIAPRLTAGDPFKLGRQAVQAYVAELNLARSAALNEQQPDQELESELERSRESLDVETRGADWQANVSGSQIITP